MLLRNVILRWIKSSESGDIDTTLIGCVRAKGISAISSRSIFLMFATVLDESFKEPA